MTISAFASGTQTATVSTEHFLSDVNVEGKFTGIVDVSAMVDGDALELRAYQMVLAGGTARVIDVIHLNGAQPTDQLIIEWGRDIKNELTDATAVRYSLKQTAGTGRAFPWKVIRESDASIHTKLDAIDDYVDTEIASLHTKVDAIDDFLDTEIAAILAAIDTEIADILADTNELQTDWTDGGRLDLILDAIEADASILNTAQLERTAAPGVNITPIHMIGYLYYALRNRMDVTSNSKIFYKDDGTVLWTKTLSDDGSTYSEGEGA
jgi:hypothetical protein